MKDIKERLFKILKALELEDDPSEDVMLAWAEVFRYDMSLIHTKYFLEKTTDDQLLSMYYFWADNMGENRGNTESRIQPIIESMWNDTKVPEYAKQEMNKIQSFTKIKLNRIKESNKYLQDVNNVDFSLCYTLVYSCAYWHSHPCGHPVSAPKHADNLTSTSEGWGVQFGANAFEAEHYLREGFTAVSQHIDKVIDKKESFNYSLLESMLELALQKSISNYNGALYDYYPETDGFIVLGAQAIGVQDAVNFILRQADLISMKNL